MNLGEDLNEGHVEEEEQPGSPGLSSGGAGGALGDSSSDPSRGQSSEAWGSSSTGSFWRGRGGYASDYQRTQNLEGIDEENDT